jgi:hypothetical protein
VRLPHPGLRVPRGQASSRSPSADARSSRRDAALRREHASYASTSNYVHPAPPWRGFMDHRPRPLRPPLTSRPPLRQADQLFRCPSRTTTRACRSTRAIRAPSSSRSLPSRSATGAPPACRTCASRRRSIARRPSWATSSSTRSPSRTTDRARRRTSSHGHAHERPRAARRRDRRPDLDERHVSAGAAGALHGVGARRVRERDGHRAYEGHFRGRDPERGHVVRRAVAPPT